MGFGNYSHAAHVALTAQRSARPVEEVFQQHTCHPRMNPKGVRWRESRDSAEHPRSLGIVFALDVTGSMGEIPKQLARRELPTFMKVLGECHVDDPQILFVGIGDATSDSAPLQVGQFESTAALMDQWLTWSYLEGGGGGQRMESYELALYFLAQHTDMDCFRKRKKRGYLFMTGDELPYPAVSKHEVDGVIGDELDDDVPIGAVVAAVQKTFEPFFLVPDLDRRRGCERIWRDLLGDRVICMESPGDTCFVAAGAVALNEGAVADLDALVRIMIDAGAGRDRVGAVVRALTPFASTLARDGTRPPRLEAAEIPRSDGPSGLRRT